MMVIATEQQLRCPALARGQDVTRRNTLEETRRLLEMQKQSQTCD
jgi:hypothetical protein